MTTKIEEYEKKIADLKLEVSTCDITDKQVDRAMEVRDEIRFYERRIKELKETAEIYGLKEI